MARLSRSTLLGYPHQVTQRGNYGQCVFEEDTDFGSYLTWLREFSRRYCIEVWAYCLMRNHVHFVCVPRANGALSRGFNTLHMRYAQYFHNKKGLTGHLWRGRFQSCILDDQSVFEEIRFIENNPVRAGIVGRAEDYRWSSARFHVLGESDPALEHDNFPHRMINDWRAYLSENGDESILNRTWRNLKTGRPAGKAEFVHSLESAMGKRLTALPRGRPKKTASLMR